MVARLTTIGLCLVLAASPAFAQAPPVAPPPAVPAPVESAPLPPPTTPSPGASAPASPPAPAPVPPGPAVAARPTLIPSPGDPVNVDEVVLPEKPVLALTGSSKWEDGLKSIRAAFARIEDELRRLGLAPAGRPLAVFLQTTDDDFRFEAMVPIESAPNPAPAVAAEMRFAATPSGKAFRFVHKGAYEDIDSTYETITTYLDAKDIVAQDAFMEEFVNDVADGADTGLEVNIFVRPK